MDGFLLRWGAFVGVVLVLLVLDLGVLNKRDHVIGVRESLKLSLFYILAGCGFGAWVWHQLGSDAGADFFTGFVIEKSLSMDNIFVMSLIFTYFKVPREYQHRVLFWGIVGVVVLRGLAIGLGSALIQEFHWVLWLFSAFLIYTGIKMILSAEDDAPEDLENNRLLSFLRTHMRVTNQFHGQSFIVRQPDPKRADKTLWFATPLLLCLVLIEISDLIFAVDSVPAIFAITTDPYIVFTSNIFAILGLRALYFALSAILHRFSYLKYALSLVLVFIGGKVIAADLLDIEKVPTVLSLGVTFGLLAGGVLFSLYKTRNVRDA